MHAKEAGRFALIIATQNYRDPSLRKLRTPAQDARALERTLSNQTVGNFDVHTLLNQPAHMVRLEIQKFFAERERDDLLLLYFSCHGIKDDSGRLFFATSDTQLRWPGATSVESTFVNELMHRSRSKQIVLLLDCCYSGAFARGMVPKAGEEALHISERFEGRGRAVFTASSAMEYSFEGEELTGEGQGSIFTRAIVQGLDTGEADRDADGWISIDELYDFVHTQVREATPNQTPGKWLFDVEGDLYIARSPRKPEVKPPQLSLELQQAIESPLAGVRMGAIAELERLLDGTNALPARAAREALESLASDDSQRVSAAANEALTRPTGSAPSVASRSKSAPQPAPPRSERSGTPLRLLHTFQTLVAKRPIVRVLGAAGLVILVVVGAFIQTRPDPEIKARIRAVPTSRTGAAALKAGLTGLLTEHVYLAALATEAALRSDTKAFDAWAAALNGETDSNSADIVAVVGSAYGPEIGNAFNSLWRSEGYIPAVFAYSRAVAANDRAMSDKTVANLLDYAKTFGITANVMNSDLDAGTVEKELRDHLFMLKDVIDAQKAGDQENVHSSLREAYHHMDRMGTILAAATAEKFPDKFDGDAGSLAAHLRTDLTYYLRESAFLVTSGTGAALGGRMSMPQFEEYADELTQGDDNDRAALTDAVGDEFVHKASGRLNNLWRGHISAVVGYSQALEKGDEAGQEKTVNDLLAYAKTFGRTASSFLNNNLTAASVEDDFEGYVTKLRAVIDAQEAGDAARVAATTREVVKHMSGTADLLAEATVRKFSEKF